LLIYRHFLDMDISLQTDAVHKFADEVVSHLLSATNELRRLFLVDDMVDSIKASVMHFLCWAVQVHF